MPATRPNSVTTLRSSCALIAAAAALLAPAAALGSSGAAARQSKAIGKLVQLKDAGGCVMNRFQARGKPCTPARSLRGPGPFLGSQAIALSPDGRNVYVASSRSNAIAIFKRDAKRGTLSQRAGAAGCIAIAGRRGCAEAVGLDHPNSVAVSPDGKNVYATAVGSDAVTVFSRNPGTGALTQATDGSGCVANAATTGCTTGRALDGADVVTVSPDGNNVYVGAFFGNAVATFNRDPATGALTQPADATGCLTDAATDGCTTGLALAAPEGMAISGDGANVYVATATSNALLVLDRDPSTGALTQAADGTGCITDAPLTGCTTGVWLAGANAVAVSPADEDVYVTSLISDAVTSFSRDTSNGDLTQQSGTAACAIYVVAVGCSLVRAGSEPEGIGASPDGASVYSAAFGSSAIDVFNRDPDYGSLIQKSGRAGCVTTGKAPDCTRGRALKKASSVAFSSDGRHLYATAFASNAIAVFKRIGVGR